MRLDQIYLYRITHIDNIPHVLQYGIVNKNSKNINPDFISIGDKSLIDTRSNKVVIISNGEFLNFSPAQITLGDFIPFYFGVKMPMLYVVQHGGNFVEKATSAENIVYMACLLKPIIDSRVTYYFSDGHATDNYTTFYSADFINLLPQIIDWEAIKQSYWGGQENLNLKRKKQAEFLVLDDLNSKYLSGFICFNKKAKNKLMAFGINENKIKILPGCYY